MSTYNIILVRYDFDTQEELQHEVVWTYTEGVSPSTMGGLVMALNNTTTCVAQPGEEENSYDIIMVRNDPYTEAPISRTLVASNYVEDPDENIPTLEWMLINMRNCIFYFPELVEE